MRLDPRDARTQAIGTLGQGDHCRRIAGRELLIQSLKNHVVCLDFAEICERRIDVLKGLVDFLADLGSSEYNLAADEDQQDDFRLDHSVDEARE